MCKGELPPCERSFEKFSLHYWAERVDRIAQRWPYDCFRVVQGLLRFSDRIFKEALLFIPPRFIPPRAPTLKAWLPTCGADGTWNLLKWVSEVDIFGSMDLAVWKRSGEPSPLIPLPSAPWPWGKWNFSLHCMLLHHRFESCWAKGLLITSFKTVSQGNFFFF